MIEIHLNGRTDVGQVREHNEDSFVMVRLDDNERDLTKLRQHPHGDKGTLLVVCDGMGGAAAGEVASSLAIVAGLNLALNHPKWTLVTTPDELRENMERSRDRFQQSA